MTLLAIGVTHRSAPLDVLDELSIDASSGTRLAADAVASPYVSEAMVLSTCNRLEIIADVAAFHASTQQLAELLAKAMGTSADEVHPHLRISYGDQAARHLFEVAAGLDSLVVGEQQIVGQVRSALAQAQHQGTAARRLMGVTQAALRSAKRVHSDTGLDRHGASVVGVGLTAVQDHLPDLASARVVLIGAGAMAALAVTTLRGAGVRDLAIVNRTPAKAARLAAGAEASAWGLADLPRLAGGADLIISCTGSTDLILTAEQFAQWRGAGPGRQQVVLDLAMPHDSDPALADLPGVVRLALADLVDRPETVASDEDLDAARLIVEEELALYMSQEAARRLDPLVVSLRARASEHVQAEADRVRARLPHLTQADQAEIENALRRVVNALMHTPTLRVRQWADDPQGRRYADALHVLFDLPTSTIEALGAPDAVEDEGWW